MKGNTDVVKLLLKYNADPNLTDVHGTSALLEAVKNGHEGTVHALASHGASLCLPESLAASILCQAVFDGDIVLLQRLLKAGIPVNVSDYDKRTASHIAVRGSIASHYLFVAFFPSLTFHLTPSASPSSSGCRRESRSSAHLGRLWSRLRSGGSVAKHSSR
jgi:ankyrin repeat protein